MIEARDQSQWIGRKRTNRKARSILLAHPCWHCGRFQIEARYCSEECRRAYIDSVIVAVG